MLVMKRTHYRLPIAIRVATHGLLPCLLLAGLTSNLYAVDGVVLIDQNRALAGNVTQGDIAGFPVTITQRGSYRLSGNLTIPNGDTTAIEILSDFVSIDLNGFSIIGPVDCSGGFPCAGRGIGTGVGIRAQRPSLFPVFNITIRNGTIQGMGGAGIDLNADSVLAEYLHIRSNGFGGIRVSRRGSDQNNVIIRHNNVQLNGDNGITSQTGMVTDNVVSQNIGFGIFLNRVFDIRFGLPGTAARNVVIFNDRGLFLGVSVSYIGNTLADNGGPLQVFGGVNLGQNLCGTVVCP